MFHSKTSNDNTYHDSKSSFSPAAFYASFAWKKWRECNVESKSDPQVTQSQVDVEAIRADKVHLSILADSSCFF